MSIALSLIALYLYLATTNQLANYASLISSTFMYKSLDYAIRACVRRAAEKER